MKKTLLLGLREILKREKGEFVFTQKCSFPKPFQ